MSQILNKTTTTKKHWNTRHSHETIKKNKNNKKIKYFTKFTDYILIYINVYNYTPNTA